MLSLQRWTFGMAMERDVFTFLVPGLVNIQKAIENGHLQWILPLKMVIFHCYVSSPEGIYTDIIDD